MERTGILQQVRLMRFSEVYTGWSEGRLTQREAALVLGVGERTFRRYINRYDADVDGCLLDKRLSRPSPRKASKEELG